MCENFEKFKSLVESLGGILLENAWQGYETLHRIGVESGEEFSQTPKKIRERGFPQDFKSYEKKTLQEKDEVYFKAQRETIKNGGTISAHYYGANREHEFTDQHGRVFLSTMKKVANGYWNPPPFEFLIVEEYCRKVFEHLTNKKFNKTRRVLTPSITGRTHALELDGYCPELKLAFEYQGHPSHWDKKDSGYEEVSTRDQLKVKCCRDLGIDLIVIEPLKTTRSTKLKVLFNHTVIPI